LPGTAVGREYLLALDLGDVVVKNACAAVHYSDLLPQLVLVAPLFGGLFIGIFHSLSFMAGLFNDFYTGAPWKACGEQVRKLATIPNTWVSFPSSCSSTP
jgi:hypothetical protein